jgi:hypothetical protein
MLPHAIEFLQGAVEGIWEGTPWVLAYHGADGGANGMDWFESLFRPSKEGILGIGYRLGWGSTISVEDLTIGTVTYAVKKD